MKLALSLLGLVALFLGVRFASNRLATHQRVVPPLWSRVNTQVHRINQ
jgi:hypothetical protein